MELVQRVAPLNSPVMLLGETGVGKEVIANAIHLSSDRHKGPFVKLNCGAIPEQLIDSELFGHEKGAFTGAIAQRKGRFERADGGTLFLDEIGDLPLEAQVRLLRVLQTKQFERVGGTATLSSDARIIAATHRDMEQLVREGKFREDLWYRIGVFPISIPPLRERRADIPALVNHFLKKKSLEMGIHHPPAIAPGAMQRLREYRWPGNVRELENVVERELILNRTGTLAFEGIESGGSVEASPLSAKPVPLDRAVETHIRRALEYTHGKVGGPDGAAELLKVNPSTLRHRMRRLGIEFGRQ